MEKSLNSEGLDKLKDVSKKHNTKAVAERQKSRHLTDKITILESLNRSHLNASSPWHRMISQYQGDKGDGDGKRDAFKMSEFSRRRRSLEEYVPLRKPFGVDVKHCSDYRTFDLPGVNETRNVQPCNWAEAVDKEEAENAMEMIKFQLRSLNRSVNTKH